MKLFNISIFNLFFKEYKKSKRQSHWAQNNYKIICDKQLGLNSG